MKTWLKGGLIVSITFLIIAIFNYMFNSCQPYGFDVFTKILYPSIWNEMFVRTGCEQGNIIIYSAVIWFILGALIAWIFGKFGLKKGKKR